MIQNKENIARKKREWRLNNREKVLTQKKRYRIKYAGTLAKKQRNYYNKNKNFILPRQQKYYKVYRKNNKQKEIQRAELYRSLNGLEINKRARKRNMIREVKDKKNMYDRNRRKTDIRYRITRNLRHRVYAAFRDYTETGKIKKADEYGIDYEAIVKKLYSKLPLDINERVYVVDHIIPLCSFDLTNPDQIKAAFCPQNHRWLLASENIKKIASDIKLSIWRVSRVE